jgi:hypothetical protein
VQRAGQIDFAVLRYLADGTLDPDFSGDGVAFADFGTSFDQARGVVFQPEPIDRTYWLTALDEPLAYMLDTVQPEGLTASAAGDVDFYSEVLPEGLRIPGGVTRIYLYREIPAGSGERSLSVQIQVGSDSSWVTLGEITNLNLSESGVELQEIPITTAPHTVAAGQRLRLRLDEYAGNLILFYWDGEYNEARLVLP